MTAMRLVITGVLLAGSAACGGAVESSPLPDGIVAHIDQSRVERKGREVFLRVENGTKEPVTIEKFELTSPRLATVDWTGDETIGATYEADLEFDMPKGRCGSEIDASVTLTYRIGDGELRGSTVAADDIYGNAALFADRDCAESTLAGAADLEVGEPRVEGDGEDSVIQLPVVLTPTGKASDVRFGGLGSTVLFSVTEPSAALDFRLDVLTTVVTSSCRRAAIRMLSPRTR